MLQVLLKHSEFCCFFFGGGGGGGGKNVPIGLIWQKLKIFSEILETLIQTRML